MQKTAWFGVTPLRTHAKAFIALIPGLLMAGLVAAFAFAARQIPYVAAINPIVLAVAAGIAIASLFGTPARARPGLAFAARHLLRASIVLLGLQVTALQLLQIGPVAVLVGAIALIATFVFTNWLGKLLGSDRGLTELIAAGTAVCGASAIIATNTVTRAPESDVAYALGSITIFGSLSIILYPLVMHQLDLTQLVYGVWSGSSIHEVAQVIAAAFQGGDEAGQSATIVKLARVLMLAPLIIVLGYRNNQKVATATERAPLLPWFIGGFIVLVFLGSVIDVPQAIRHAAAVTTSVMFTIALAALGLSTHVQAVTSRGWKPLLVGAAAWIFIAVITLGCTAIAARLEIL